MSVLRFSEVRDQLISNQETFEGDAPFVVSDPKRVFFISQLVAATSVTIEDGNGKQIFTGVGAVTFEIPLRCDNGINLSAGTGIKMIYGSIAYDVS